MLGFKRHRCKDEPPPGPKPHRLHPRSGCCVLGWKTRVLALLCAAHCNTDARSNTHNLGEGRFISKPYRLAGRCLDHVQKVLTINLPNGFSQMGSCSCHFENKECQWVQRVSSPPTGWPPAHPNGAAMNPSRGLPAPRAAAWTRQHPGQSSPAWSPGVSVAGP